MQFVCINSFNAALIRKKKQPITRIFEFDKTGPVGQWNEFVILNGRKRIL